MNARKSFKTSRHSNKRFSLRLNAFIFIDKKTGTNRFKVKPVASDWTASFLFAGAEVFA
jgi:hypothetical protein